MLYNFLEQTSSSYRDSTPIERCTTQCADITVLLFILLTVMGMQHPDTLTIFPVMEDSAKI